MEFKSYVVQRMDPTDNKPRNYAGASVRVFLAGTRTDAPGVLDGAGNPGTPGWTADGNGAITIQAPGPEVGATGIYDIEAVSADGTVTIFVPGERFSDVAALAVQTKSSADLVAGLAPTVQANADQTQINATQVATDRAIVQAAAQFTTTRNDVRLAVQGKLASYTYDNTAKTITFSAVGSQVADGVNVAVGNRLVVPNEGVASGIYDVTTNGPAVAGVWARSADCDTGAELVGACVRVTESSSADRVNARYRVDQSEITLGTTPITFSQQPGAVAGEAAARAAADALKTDRTGNKAASLPNQFTADELAFRDSSGITVGSNTSLTFENSAVTGKLRAKTTNTGSANTRNMIIAKSVAGLNPSIPTISGAITIENSSGTTRSVTFRQKNAAGTILGTPLVKTPEILTGEQVIQTPGVARETGVASVEWVISMSKATGDYFYVGDQYLADGPSAEFTPPPRGVNLWPDPLCDDGNPVAGFKNGVARLEGGKRWVDFSGADTLVRRFRFDAVDEFAPGAILSLIGTRVATYTGSPALPLGQACAEAFVFLDASLTEISRVENTQINAASGVEEAVAVKATVPTCAYVDVWVGKRLNTTKMSYAALDLKSSLSQSKAIPTPRPPNIIRDRRVFVSAAGSNSGSGSEASPLLTLAAAVASDKVANGGEIIINSDGEFALGGAPLDLSAITGPVSIIARSAYRAYATRSTKLTSITKTGGYSKVYQSTVAEAVIPTVGNEAFYYAWHHDVPDATTLIALADRLAPQRGRSNRLPHTRIRYVASIAAIDAASTPSWYYDRTAGIFYFSIAGGADATAADIRLPQRSSPCIQRTNGITSIIGLEILYGHRGLSFTAADRVELYDVIVGACTDNPIYYSNIRFATQHHVETFGGGNDGFGGHASPANGRRCVTRYLDCWSHDNGGDGSSDHEYFEDNYEGGLYEYNGKAGIVPANGCHATARGVHARNNGLITAEGGGGFAITNAATDGGVGTQFDIRGCVSERNPFNYMCGPNGAAGGTAEASQLMRLFDTLSLDATTAGLFANTGTLYSFDSRDAGSAQAKMTISGGQIVVRNSPVVS